jgi:hypothetical protein
MLKNKNNFQVNISLSVFFIAFCDLFTDFPSYFMSTMVCCVVTLCGLVGGYERFGETYLHIQP